MQQPAAVLVQVAALGLAEEPVLLAAQGQALALHHWERINLVSRSDLALVVLRQALERAQQQGVEALPQPVVAAEPLAQEELAAMQP